MERLSSSEAFRARSVAYELLARFFRHGLTSDVYTELSVLPGLRNVLPEVADPDAMAADHYGILGLDVLPYASTYLEADGRLGGAATEFMTRMLLAAGEPVARSEAPDHIATELDMLSMLCEQQSGTTPDESDRLLDVQRRMLHHLFSWLPVFQHALSRGHYALYRETADTTLQVAVDHARALPATDETPAALRLPGAPDLLSDRSTGLRQLAEFLSRPARSGLVLTRSAIERMARELGLPRGFGDRSLMLGNLLGAAGTYGAVGDLVERIRVEARDWRAHFEALNPPDVPALSDASLAWRRQVEGTLRLLDEVEARVSGADARD